MKKTIAKILLAVSAIAAPLAACADLIWYDGFQYPNGSLTNVSSLAWFKFSGTAVPSDMYVVSSNLQVCGSSGSIMYRQDDCGRQFSVTNNSIYTNQSQVVYASFTIICSTAISNNAGLPNGPGSYFAGFYSTAGGYFGRVQAFTNGTILPNTWRLGVTDNAASTNNANGGFPVDLAVNTPYQVVEELDPLTVQAATIWVNPISPNNTGLSPIDVHYTANDSLKTILNNSGTNVNAFTFRQASGMGNSAFIITNCAVATTFAEAMTNLWSTNAAAPVIVYQPVGVTNYVGASITLSAVANGQGLGNMTYQWFQGSTPYPNGNGANALNIPSAQISDSGNYTLVATTPYGLSVTSSVAKVSISSAPVPPSFVTEPVNQSVYAGQSVIFSCSVISPGNVTFTWYSNNVVVTSGQTDSGNTSTLELDNVTPSSAGSYKVAVTNDVVANGVVSTNATLTIKVPAAVSIGYLRTLVDPVTFQPTNVPPSIAYQATGIVTTYTNITTGDTSSYFLQDGTGGINIFVTGGSTFRPQLGDVVTFVGVLSTYTTGLELYADATGSSAFPYTSFTVLSNNIAGLPAPEGISYNILTNVNNANYNLGGLLVQISDVHFGARAGTTTSTTANDTVVVTNSAGQTFQLLFPDLDLDVAGQTLPNYAYSVSGVLYSANDIVTNMIVVTRFSDIVTNAPAMPIPLGVGYSAGTLTFNWADSSFSLQSATNVAGPYTTIPGAISGFTTNASSAPMMFFRLYHH